MLELSYLNPGDFLTEIARGGRHVYFPVSSVVSVVHTIESGVSVEIATVGNEGMIGMSLIAMDKLSQNSALVTSAGHAYRLGDDLFREEFGQSPAIQRTILCHVQALLAQMAHTAVCNHHHSVDQRLCRWILMSLDRQASDIASMSLELIADMLAVDRGRIYEASGKLEASGAIRRRESRISILNRSKIRETSCKCYDLVRGEYNRLLPASSMR